MNLLKSRHQSCRGPWGFEAGKINEHRRHGSGSIVLGQCGSVSSSGPTILSEEEEEGFCKNLKLKKSKFLWSNCNSCRTIPATGGAFSPPKRTCSTSKHETSFTFCSFHFCGSLLPSWIRIRIRIPKADPDGPTKINADAVSQHWVLNTRKV